MLKRAALQHGFLALTKVGVPKTIRRSSINPARPASLSSKLYYHPFIHSPVEETSMALRKMTKSLLGLMLAGIKTVVL